MLTTVTLSKEAVDDKIRKLDLQIKELQKTKELHELLLKSYFDQTASPSVEPFNPLPTTYNLDTNKPVKELIVDLLRVSGKKMTMKQIQSEFRTIKPNVSETTVRVSVFEVGRKDKYPVTRKNGQYWYEEKEPQTT